MPNQFFSPEGDLENYFVTEYWLIDQYVGDELWTWGRNNFGQLGTNDTTPNRSTPVTTFAGGTNWKQVAGGYEHTVAIKTDGTLWTLGRGAFGSIGDNTSGNKLTPVTTFSGGTDWKSVGSASVNGMGIKTNGTLWVWGSNSSGRLGVNDSTSTTRFTPVTTFAGGTNWRQISVSSSSAHMAAIKTDGTLWTWGLNDNRLGDGTTTNRSIPVQIGFSTWKQVACGGSHTAAVRTDGTLWIWGNNSYQVLGVNDIFSRPTPVTTFAGGTNWKQVSCGDRHTAAIKSDGTLWVWGVNSNVQLGDNTTTTKLTPVTTFAGGTNWKQVSCGFFHTAAIKTDGTIWTWGRNSYGQLGDNTFTNKSTPVTTFAGGTNWKQVSGGNITSAVFSGTTPDLPIS